MKCAQNYVSSYRIAHSNDRLFTSAFHVRWFKINSQSPTVISLSPNQRQVWWGRFVSGLLSLGHIVVGILYSFWKNAALCSKMIWISEYKPWPSGDATVYVRLFSNVSVCTVHCTAYCCICRIRDRPRFYEDIKIIFGTVCIDMVTKPLL